MAKLSAEQIKKNFKQAKGKKTVWMETYEEAMEYAAPQRENFDYEYPGRHKDGAQRVFDSTAQNAMFKFASNLQSSLVPPMKRWVELAPGARLPNTKTVQQTLSQISFLLFAGLKNSNFDTQIAECFLDLAIGTGALLVQPGTANEPFKFTAVPLKDIYLEEGEDGRVGTSYRYFEPEYQTIEATWPDAKIPEDMKKDYEEIKRNKKVKLIETSYYDRDSGNYHYCLIAEKYDAKLLERTSRTNPFIIFRWANMPGETYGRGPILTALPDIKTLNKTKELLLQSASVQIFGMYTLDSNSDINVDNIKFGPAAIIEMPETMGGSALKPLPMNGAPNLAQIVIEDLKVAINAMMFADPLGPIDAPVKTATEISLRQQELSKRIGSAFGKLQYEFIAPLIKRLLDIMDQLGLIDLGDFVVGSSDISINHVSPLAMAQNEEDIIRTSRYVETLVGLYGPELALAMHNPAKFSEQLAEKLNIDPEIPVEAEQIQAALEQFLGGNSGQPQGNVPQPV